MLIVRRHQKMLYLGCLLVLLANVVRGEEDLSQMILADNADCKEDIKAVQSQCELRAEDLANNWAVIDCLNKVDKSLSPSCSTLVWQYKLSITKGDMFLSQATQFCGSDEQKELCGQEDLSQPGHLLSCLVERRHKAKDVQCSKFLAQLESIIMSDYRLVSGLVAHCAGDVNKTKCGSGSQGETIECLSKMVDSLSPNCKREVFNVAEIQAEDYQLDHALFMACREETVCQGVGPGEGKMYQCLVTHRKEVSNQCKEQLDRRQRMASEDFKVEGGLMSACGADITKYNCSKGNDDLANVLGCLEDQIREERPVDGGCINQMRMIRQELMEDYSLSPFLAVNCKKEIETYCEKEAEEKKEGQTIHCLMKAAMDNEKDEEKTFDPQCRQSLNQLLSEAQPNMDWEADPVLEDACWSVVQESCDSKKDGDTVLSCLMDEMSKGGPAMTTECSEVLLQIHYFLSREVYVDHHLYKACKKDAETLCDSSPGWHKTDKDPRHKLVFPCLVRNLYNEEDDGEDDDNEKEKDDYDEDKLSDECTSEVERTLRQRAVSVLLQPEVEKACRSSLHKYCTSHTLPGAEMMCLQDNLAVLEKAHPDCARMVSKVTVMESKNPTLHPIISKACANLIDRKCGAESKSGDGTGVMECLVRHKLEHPTGSQGAMNKKCSTVVEHWQLLSLQDWKFNFQFKEACKEDIRDHCTNPRPKKKWDVVSCLSMIVTNDTVLEQKHRIKKPCRAELKLELLEKHSNIKLDPDLQSACKQDLTKFCSNTEDEDGGLECLKTQKHKDLTEECRNHLFREEEEEAEDNEVDFALMRGCKREIKEHCAEQPASRMLECLKQFSSQDSFDDKCLNILRRRIGQHMRDYRLNPRLRKSCHLDIPKFCKSVIQEHKKDGEFFEGRMIECLREQAIQETSMLTDSCQKEIVSILRDAAPIVDADPILVQNCPNSLAKCRARADSGPKIHECLKELFETNKLVDNDECRRHMAIIVESFSADIHLDPVLHDVCSIDIAKFCREVPLGQGKQFACLVAVNKEKNFSLEPHCREILNHRVEMYNMALEVAPLQSAQMLYSSVMESPHRNSLVSSFFIFLGIVFMFGLCFGRVTKRIRSEIKNR